MKPNVSVAQWTEQRVSTSRVGSSILPGDSNLAAIASLMTEPSLPWEFFVDFWLACPIDGVDSEDELRALYDRQKEVVQ